MPELPLRFISDNTWSRWAIVWSCLALVSVASADTANPHRLSADKTDCDLCHASSNFDRPEKLCFSCHRCLKDEGRSNCLNCHQAHGAADVVLFIKKGWMDLEVSRWSRPFHNRESDCLTCHRSISPNEEGPDLKHGGDISLICGDCHGRGICRHPVGIVVPDDMISPPMLRLDDEKRITCITCHRPECEKDNSISLVGFSRKGGVQTNELCYQCHKPVADNPHIDILKRRNCRDCHGIVPRGAGSVADYIPSSNARLVCLLCHPERPHPAGYEHLGVLDKRQVNMPTDSFGRITCTSCHNPHAGPSLSCRTNEATCIDCHKEHF